MLDENTRIKETNSYEISEELLNTICDYIHTMSKNIEEVHKNMKLAISSLNEIDLKLIEKLIKGNTVNKTEKSKLNNS